MSKSDAEWERIRIEIERLRISQDTSPGLSGLDPRGKVAESYLSQGSPYRALEVVREMRDNPVAAVAGYEQIANHYLKQGRQYRALEVAREEHSFLKGLFGKK